MNEKQPYEKHLAEKLQQLPPPGDANRSWEQMRSLLDKDLPTGGIGGNGRNGYGRWWMIGIIAGIILLGGWIMLNQSGKTKTNVSFKTTAQNSSVKETTPSSGVSLPDPSAKKNNKDVVASQQAGVEKNKDKDPLSPANPGNPVDKSNKQSEDSHSVVALGSVEKKKVTNPDASATQPVNNIPEKNISKGRKKNNLSSKTNEEINSSSRIVETRLTKNNSSNKSKGNRSGIGKTRLDKSTAGRTKYPLANNQEAGKDDAKKMQNGFDNTENNAGPSSLPVERKLHTSVVHIKPDQSGLSLAGPAIILRDSMEREYAVWPVNTQKPLTKQSRKNSRRPPSYASSNKTPKAKSTSGNDQKIIATGLSLPLAFPLADQQPIAYNINGGPNTISDYVPVPHLQYHFNNKAYLQTEIQFLSPQYIQPVLLYQHKKEIAGSTNYRFVTSSIYAKKLYYFNIPLGIHYSPFKNFYLGTGLQFSSLLSGIALYDERGYNSLSPTARDSVFSQHFLKFRKDSVSHKLDGSEFRLMLDANYYWNRFTVGLRYNQALSNYVSIRVSNTSPYFTDKNKSIQFYLRYNLWEDRKRNKPGTGLLSFK